MTTVTSHCWQLTSEIVLQVDISHILITVRQLSSVTAFVRLVASVVTKELL